MKKKALFIINTLSNGGAERVCTNLANELIKENFDVDFILLGKNGNNKKAYDINSEIRIYNLNINTSNKIIKILKILFSVYKVNKIIAFNEKEIKYSLITSHLPMANILTMLTIVKRRALYVFHTKISSCNKYNSKLFKPIFKYIFKNKKIVTVSDGVRKEAIYNYNLKGEFIKTIYNPININEIEMMANDNIDKIGKYFIQVGRFNEAKRQDRMIDIFYEGEFFKNYKLVFCGTGELENQAKDKVKKYRIEESVLFLGWQDNVYKWIKNAELLICTSDYEAFPMNLIEALALNVKVVSSNCDYGPQEIMIDSFANYLVESDNIKEYIKKINLALKQYPSVKNKIISKCQVANIVNEYIEFMENNKE